jgi:hypothetical protein
MTDCSASYQSGTGLKKTNDAGNNPVPELNDAVRHFIGPVPDWDDECRNADAGVSFLDADAHLWKKHLLLQLHLIYIQYMAFHTVSLNQNRVMVIDISQYRLLLGFFLLYADRVPFELLNSAVLLWRESCGGRGQICSIPKFDHHNINGGAVDNTWSHR